MVLDTPEGSHSTPPRQQLIDRADGEITPPTVAVVADDDDVSRDVPEFGDEAVKRRRVAPPFGAVPSPGELPPATRDGALVRPRQVIDGQREREVELGGAPPGADQRTDSAVRSAVRSLDRGGLGAVDAMPRLPSRLSFLPHPSPLVPPLPNPLVVCHFE